MPSFQSNQEYFQAVTALMAKLELGGHQQAADELRDGYRCLNGLTDGWALFLESVEKVQATHAKRFSREDQQTLEVIRAAAHKIVYRPWSADSLLHRLAMRFSRRAPGVI